VTSFQKIEANQRKATRSTRPIAEAGKQAHGKTLSGTGCAPKPSSESSKMSETTKALRRRLGPTTAVSRTEAPAPSSNTSPGSIVAPFSVAMDASKGMEHSRKCTRSGLRRTASVYFMKEHK